MSSGSGLDFGNSLHEMKRELDRLAHEYHQRFVAAAKEEGEAIYHKSQESVPRDKGALHDDSGIEVKEGNNGDVDITIWYGRGEAKDYALSVHETPSEHDPPSWRGKPVTFQSGGPKFIEKPVREVETGMMERVGKKVFT